MIFADRTDAGRKLAAALYSFKRQDVLVYALPRGGIVLGVEVARVLQAPLDLIVVRKVGHPQSPEYAIAAVAEDGHMVTDVFEVSRVDRDWFEREVAIQRQEARRRREMLVGGWRPASARGRTAIIVDDGLATGLTMMAAVQEVRHDQPQCVVIAVPVAAAATVRELKSSVDEIVALYVGDMFGAISSYYSKFDQVSDAEAIDLLRGFTEEVHHAPET